MRNIGKSLTVAALGLTFSYLPELCSCRRRRLPQWRWFPGWHGRSYQGWGGYYGRGGCGWPDYGWGWRPWIGYSYVPPTRIYIPITPILLMEDRRLCLRHGAD
jgi:hypothetical protein